MRHQLGDTYDNNLLKAVAEGTRGRTIEDVDRAGYNSLKQRFDLGLFDPQDAYDWPTADDVGAVESAALNLLASQSSLVILRNDQKLLPLAKSARIAVIGPHSQATKVLVEPYAFKPVVPFPMSGTLSPAPSMQSRPSTTLQMALP